jgi:hypothetical protein
MPMQLRTRERIACRADGFASVTRPVPLTAAGCDIPRRWLAPGRPRRPCHFRRSRCLTLLPPNGAGVPLRVRGPDTLTPRGSSAAYLVPLRGHGPGHRRHACTGKPEHTSGKGDASTFQTVQVRRAVVGHCDGADQISTYGGQIF